VADKAKNVVLNFKMDGQVQYAETLREINAIMNTAAKEYKNHIAAMDKDATVTDKLTAEKKKLEIQLEAARKRTQMLREQYEAMANDTKTTTGQLTQMYSKLLDSERAEMALQKSLDRVNEGLSEEAIQARDAKEVLNQLQNESKTLEAEQKNLTSSFKLQNAQLGENASESEKTELAQKQLAAQMELTDRIVKNLEQQLEQAKKIYGENSREVMQLETKINQAKTEVAQFGEKLEGLKGSGQTAEQSLEGINKKLSAAVFMEAAEQLQGISDKLLEIGKQAMEMGLSFGDSQTYLQANLGLTADEAEKLNGVVENVFKHGVVESTEEASQAVMLVKRSFGDLNNADLEKLTNQITTISKRTGTDVQENVRAAQKLMDSFGISGEHALDLIAAGYQNGLNMSDDFLDTLNEYSPHFKAAGYSAEQMFQIIKNGMENGAMNTDKAADAVKEFQIRLGDGSFQKIIGSFSKDTQEMFKKWQDGKATVADVAESVSKDLNKMTPTKQQEALSLLSSQFEDLGINGAKALFQVGDAFKDTAGKADEMAKKSPGEKWQSALRELHENLLPIGQSLVDAFTPFIDVMSKMAEWFDKLPGPVKTFVAVFGSLLAVAAALTPVILALVVAIGALEVELLPIVAIVVGIAAAIAALIVVIKNWGKITDWLSDKWGQFTSWLSNGVTSLVKNFVKWFDDMKKGAVQKFADLKDGAIATIVSFKENVMAKVTELKEGFVNKAKELKDSIIGKYNELKDGVVEKFNNLRDAVGEIMQEAKEKIIEPIEAAKEKISGIIDKIKSFFANLRLKIPKIELPPLPHLKLEWDTKSFFGKEISYPTGFDVEWYAKGGIFTRPTIFDTPYGIKGVGEAGPEAVLPLNEETLGAIGEAIAKTMKGSGTEINIYSRDDANAIARATERALRRIAFQM
jgi:phage-related minor tail protein